MADYTPTVTKEDIDRIAKRDYPDYPVEKIWEVLKGHSYGEAYRVYAAALKEGQGNLERLKEMIDLANTDFRDLLSLAEYPAQMKDGFFSFHRSETYEADKKQYHDWFKE